MVAAILTALGALGGTAWDIASGGTERSPAWVDTELVVESEVPCSADALPSCQAVSLGALRLPTASPMVVRPWNMAGIIPCVTTSNTSRADIKVAQNLLRREALIIFTSISNQSYRITSGV
jgi:hypothetical protein